MNLVQGARNFLEDWERKVKPPVMGNVKADYRTLSDAPGTYVFEE